MKNSKHLYAILGIVTVLTAVGISAPAAKVKAAPPGGTQNVLVTNATNQPVPTMSMGGTVSVSTLPPVTFSGTPEVKVANSMSLAHGSSIEVNNTNDNPVPVDVRGLPPKTPIHKSAKLDFTASNFSVSSDLYTVPNGKRLTITTIYAQAGLAAPQNILRVRIGHLPLYMPDGRQVSFGTTLTEAVAEAESMYDEGTEIKVYALRSDDASLGEIVLGFDGYLEDMPTQSRI